MFCEIVITFIKNIGKNIVKKKRKEIIEYICTSCIDEETLRKNAIHSNPETYLKKYNHFKVKVIKNARVFPHIKIRLCLTLQ